MECGTCTKWGRYSGGKDSIFGDNKEGWGGCKSLGQFCKEDFFCKNYNKGITLDQVED